jgi:hypothetical protein
MASPLFHDIVMPVAMFIILYLKFKNSFFGSDSADLGLKIITEDSKI